jgi:hypothetical protein
MSELRKPRGNDSIAVVSKEFMAIKAPIDEYVQVGTAHLALANEQMIELLNQMTCD